MLKQRIITAMLLFAFVLVAIIWFPPIVFTCLVAFVIAISAWEWAGLTDWQAYQQLIYAVFLAGLVFLAGFVAPIWILVPSVCWWLFAGVLVICYPRFSGCCTNTWYWRALMGIIVLIPLAVGIQVLRAAPDGIGRLLLALFIVWAADTGAYFSGRRFGRRKLAPIVSPNKTIEGAIGGLILAFVPLIVASIWLVVVRTFFGWMLLLVLVTVIFAVVGDLFESLLKRQAGVKDSSQLIPGHGGLLDRIDSLCAAIPVFAAGMLLMTGFSH